MPKNKRHLMSDEEILSLINKDWKKARSYAKLKERAKNGWQDFFSGKLIDKEHRWTLNHVWKIFYTYPETFAIKEYAEKIKLRYESIHIGMTSQFTIQRDNFFQAYLRMVELATKLYQKLLDKRNEDLKNGKGKVVMGKNITLIMKKNLENDLTLLSKISSSRKILLYLKERGVITVADYIKLTRDAKRYDSFFHFARQFPIEHGEFKTSIIRRYYIKNHIPFITEKELQKQQEDNKTADELENKNTDKYSAFDPDRYNLFDDDFDDTEDSEAENSDNEESKKEDAPEKTKQGQDKLAQVEKNKLESQENIEQQEGQLQDDTLENLKPITTIEDLEKLDPEYFEEGSEKIEKVYKIVEDYLNRISKTLMADHSFTVEEVEALVAEEKQKYMALVDNKREDLKRKRALSRLMEQNKKM